jgi:uncharacterized protein (DUF362 family)
VLKLFFVLVACLFHPGLHAQPSLSAARASSASAEARVLVAHAADATESFKADAVAVQRLVDRAVVGFTRERNVAAAWRKVVATNDVVGIKVFSAPGPSVGTRPEVVQAIVNGLLAAGLPKSNIVIWDRQLSLLRRAGFQEVAESLGVRLAGALEAGWDAEVFYESPLIGSPVFGDLEFGRKGEVVGRRSHATRLLTKELTKVINVAPLLNHHTAGVCGNLYSLAMACADNTLRFEGDAAKLAEAIPDLYNLPHVGERVALNVVDALICQFEGQLTPRLHNSVALNQVRVSTDPVALDRLSLDEIHSHRQRLSLVASGYTNALPVYRNAALLELGVFTPPSIHIEVVK